MSLPSNDSSLEVFADSTSLQPILRVIDRSLTTLKDLGIDIGDNPIRSGNRLFVQHYPQGLAKWGVFLTGFHEQDHAIRASIAYPRKSTRSSQNAQRREPEEGNVAEPGERDATVWWESAAAMTIHSLLRGPLRCCCRASELDGCVQLGPGLVTLLQCTWCGDTTALIKQCGGCKHAWYVIMVPARCTLELNSRAGTVTPNANVRIGLNIGMSVRSTYERRVEQPSASM